jgi:hypothetical protein
VTLDVLIETQPDGTVAATLLGWPDSTVHAATEAEALARVRQLLASRLASARIVPLEIDLSPTAHPWLALAQRFKDNPLLAEVVAAIAADRRDRDAPDSPTP